MVVARTEVAEKPGCVCYVWVWCVGERLAFGVRHLR